MLNQGYFTRKQAKDIFAVQFNYNNSDNPLPILKILLNWNIVFRLDKRDAGYRITLDSRYPGGGTVLVNDNWIVIDAKTGAGIKIMVLNDERFKELFSSHD